MLATFHPQILALHISCVLASGALFLFRAFAGLRSSRLAQDNRLRRLSYLIDSLLLLAAILLTRIIHQYPLLQAWLSAKVLLLLLYIVLGSVALRHPQRRQRAWALCGALLVYANIIAVAVQHNPRGLLLLL